MPGAFADAVRKGAMALGAAAALIALPAHAVEPYASSPAAQPSGRWREASLDDYRSHLQTLSSLVEACAKARDLTHCDPMLVGPDDRIPVGSGAHAGRRLVRYGWLRVLFSRAEEADEPAAEHASGSKTGPAQSNAQPIEPTTTQLLLLARERLARDFAQAGIAAASSPAYPAERTTMQQVLAGPDFRNLQEPTVSDSMMEKLSSWLNRLFQSAATLRSRSPWVGRALVWGFILMVCVGLVYALLQLERRWRLHLTPETGSPATPAAPARNWQHWLDEARRFAAAGQWRGAIHCVYWASIARLESKRLWPADRARTPREYLALVAPDDPRKSGLAQLTRCFERTWYGGQPAGESDYHRAESLATTLMQGLAGHANGGAE